MAEPAKGQALRRSIDLKLEGTVDGWILSRCRPTRRWPVVFDEAEWTLWPLHQRRPGHLEQRRASGAALD